MYKYLLATILILSACAPAVPSSPCGDGDCSGPENALNCPADCAAAGAPDQAPGGAGVAAPTQAGQAAPGAPSAGEAPLIITTMTHMEQGFTDDREQAVFNVHVDQLRYGMSLAEEYGARLTIESEQPFARANAQWGLNIMREIVDRGHGVGTHCDLGFNDNISSVEQLARAMRENKQLVDALVGAQNNRGCSGGGGSNDWALAAAQAGFSYLDGIVGMHYLSMPLSARPDPTWTDAWIRSEGYHFSAPYALEERIYPFMVADALDFVPDANGVILVSSGEFGRLDWLAEERQGEGAGCGRRGCPFTNEDADALTAQIRDVASWRDRSRVAKLTIYIPAANFTAENEQAFRFFFSQMQALENEGLIQWATQGEVYDTYMEWNR